MTLLIADGGTQAGPVRRQGRHEAGAAHPLTLNGARSLDFAPINPRGLIAPGEGQHPQ